MEFFLSLILGLVVVFFYYRLLWYSSKIRGKELKLEIKHGKNSPLVEKFRKKHKKFYHSRIFRLGLFALATFAVWKFFGKQGLFGFFIALIVGNLLLFPYGWIKSSKQLNGENS